MNINWISKIEWDMPHKTSRLKMSKALIKRGHNVTLYMVKKFGEKRSVPDNIICIPTINLPILSGFFYGLIVFFYFPILFSKKKIDIIIIDCTKVWLPFIIPLKILNIPLILDIRTLPIDRDETFSFNLSMRLSRYIIDGITTITPELENTLRTNYNLTNIKIGIWSSGVSVNDFKFDNNSLVNKDLKDQQLNLIYHGDYSPTRGIENLIKAISKIDSNLIKEIKLLIVGMPNNKIDSLSNLIENERVAERIKILPKVSYTKMADFLKNSDVGIIPLPPENKWWRVSAPLKTLEYLAAGKPIIATDIPFHCKIFEKGNFGILLKSGSPEDIAYGIIEFYKNKENYKKLGKEGSKIVKEFYTWDFMAQKFEGFLINYMKKSKNEIYSKNLV